MKIALLPAAFGALALCLCAARGTAQISSGPLGSALPTLVVNFAIPQSVEPSRLTYTQLGTLYTNTDGRAPGDNQGAPITGQLLLPGSLGGGGGLELHSRIPAPSTTGTTPITEVDFYTTYTGTLQLTTTAAPGFTPWQFAFITPLAGFAQGFSYYKTNPSQASIDDFTASFGLLTATPSNPNDTSFANAGLGAHAAQHPQDVPEPGTLALLGGLCAGGGLLWRRRGKHKK